MTSQSLDKRFIFRLAGGEEMIHLAHWGPAACRRLALRSGSPCRSCWGPRCRPRHCRPASAPGCLAAPPRWPRCCSTRSVRTSWVTKLIVRRMLWSWPGWRDPLPCARPVPAILNGGLQILPVTPPAHQCQSPDKCQTLFTWSCTSSPRSRCRARPPPSARASPNHSPPWSRCWWSPCRTPFTKVIDTKHPEHLI